ncbi:MAG TPA: cytochrome c oxidase assembly protein [Actinomycetota bacterium]|nr:cytochrome c oxidase assembly protein [Actinomycetota bacterium]
MTFAADASFGWSDWHPHIDVWLVMVACAVLYAAAIKAWAPAPVGAERVGASRVQITFFYCGLAILWIGADFPIHDLAENYLFSVHMFQHLLFSLVAPPLILLGIPSYVMRRLFSPRWLWRLARFATRPVVALIAFNFVIAFTHWPALVDAAVTSELLHFTLHLVLFVTATMMWWPVVAPLPEFARLSEPAKMLYLFLQSIVPTVPASFLTFASAPIYKVYVSAPRLWGLDVVTDQRIAGLLMKILGGLILWVAIAIIFFRWNAKEQNGEVEEVPWEDFERELQAWDMRST